MPIYTILFGVALMGVGVGTYVASGEEAGMQGFVLQMILGLLAVALGVGSIIKKEMRKHLIHGAVILATLLVLMGVVIPVIEFVSHLTGLERAKQMDMLRALLTVVFSGAYVYLAVKSFRAARRSRKDGTADPPSSSKPDSDPAPVQ
ncbi:MAG: hypothetical protein KTR15_11780 [Phycisphaeraceae bacterium]|nr:hypothetical protein [Phycisphaeraceae bacterium]